MGPLHPHTASPAGGHTGRLPGQAGQTAKLGTQGATPLTSVHLHLPGHSARSLPGARLGPLPN